jgi:hypothetical protein
MPMTEQTPAQATSTTGVPTEVEDSLTAQKKVEHYAATVNAWYATALEHDKSLFVLAGGGIGIMISLLTTVGFETYWVLPLFLAAICAFLNCLHYLLKIFEGNRHYLEALIHGRHQEADSNLKHWDKIAKNSFYFGVIFATAVGMAVAGLKIQAQQKEKEKVSSQDKASQPRAATGGVEGGMPQPLGKSFQGAGNLAPSVPAASPASSTASGAPPATQPASAPASSPAPAGATTPSTKP